MGELNSKEVYMIKEKAKKHPLRGEKVDSCPFSPLLLCALGADLHGSEFPSPLASNPARRMCQKISERIEGKLEFIPSFSPCRHQFGSNYISLPKATAMGGPLLPCPPASSHFLPTAPPRSWVLFLFCDSLHPPCTIMSSPSMTSFHTHRFSEMLGRGPKPPAYCIGQCSPTLTHAPVPNSL